MYNATHVIGAFFAGGFVCLVMWIYNVWRGRGD